MQNGNFPRISMLIIAASITAVFAQYVYINGAANYLNGNPVVGAQVSLKAAGISTLTDSNGIFMLYGYVAALAVQKTTSGFKPSLGNDKLHFYIPVSPTPVKIELFDLNGKACGTVVNEPFASGEYFVPINKVTLARQVYLLKVSIGSSVDVFRLPKMNASHSGEIRAKPAGNSCAVFRKKAALGDTVVAIAQDGATQKKVIDTLISTVLFTFDNPAGTDADAALLAMPMVMPLVQISCFRYCTYYKIAKPIPYSPTFNPDSLNYSASFDSTIVIGIKPAARSASAKVAVTLDNAPVSLCPWYDYPYTYLLNVFYTCTLSTPNQTRTFSTAVTAGDNVSKKTYTISLKRQ
jgi:hypothetical protein